MIRRIVITSLLLVAALTASAQRSPIRVEWGIMGGVNVPEFTTNMSKTEIRNKLGWQAGIMTAVNFGAVAIEPQILYVRQGMRIRTEGEAEVNVKSNSIDVPVLASLRLLRPVRIFAGPVFTVLNAASRSRAVTCSTSGACVRRSPIPWARASRCCATSTSTCATTASSRARRMWRCPTTR